MKNTIAPTVAMRRRERQITSPATFAQILNANQIAVVSMVDGQVPYAVALNYAPVWTADDTFFLYFHSAPSGRKIDCLRRNPAVSVFIHDQSHLHVIDGGRRGENWTTHYRSVILTGKMEWIEEMDAKRIAALQFMKHYTPGPIEISESALNRTVFLRLTPETLSGKQNPPEK